MAHPQPSMDITDFDEVALSGNESDASYDMADDEVPQTAQGTGNSFRKPAFEAPKTDTINEDNDNDKGKGKALELGPENSNRYVPHPSNIHRAKIGQTSDEKETEEEKFYDMYSDQRLGRLRRTFKQEGQLVLDLLESLVGLEQSGWKDVSLALQECARKIALMFGDDIPKMKRDLHTALDGMAVVRNENNNVWIENKKVKLELQKETKARQNTKEILAEAMETISKTQNQYMDEKWARKAAESLYEKARKVASTFEEKYLREVNGKKVLVHGCEQLEEPNGKVLARLKSQLEARELQLQEMKEEHKKEFLIRSQLQAELQDKLEQEVIARNELAAKLRSEEDLFADIKQLDNARIHVIEELDVTKIQLRETAEELDAAKARNRQAAAGPKLIEELGTTKTKLLRATEELDATKVKYSQAVEDLKWTKISHCAELRSEQDAKEDALSESIELKEALATANKQVKSLSTQVKGLVTSYVERAHLIQKHDTQLNKLMDQLNEMMKLMTTHNHKSGNAESGSTSEMLEQIREKDARIFSLRAQFDVATKAHNKLVDDKTALSTLIVRLEKDIEEEKNYSEKVRRAISTIFQQIYKMPELEDMTQLLVKSRGTDVAQQEALDEIARMVTSFCNKIMSLDEQYRAGSGPFSPSTESCTDVENVETVSQELLDTKSELASSIAALKKATQNNLQLSASHATALKKLNQTNLQLVTSHAAALKELNERRGQINEFEAMQVKLQLNEGRAVAQMKQMKTESQCMKDLHNQDLERILRLEAELHNLRQQKNL
ncbi:uncharacterized protein RCO7_05076 [Rhynchosporium graminicola]|uniref:Uncharacterized protein n=1 Tax=Rhynchosporium graminicola TaxID=2792576 RepID=A0A1E1KDC5_9HELO|nr:uncharacterized protein RCO7_05076 [Rhynchosporium commune]